MKQIQLTIVIAFALFAIMFGAGNVIFPVQLGVQNSSNWIQTFIGFGFSELILTLTGYLVINQFQSLENFGQWVGLRFIKVFFSVFILSLIFIFAPRTAALSYEMLSSEYLPSMSSIFFYIIYFLICYVLILKPSSIFDIIGKYLAPALLLTIFYTLISSLWISPLSSTEKSLIFQPISFAESFRKGFFLGYQTGDTLSSTLPWGLLTSMLIAKGVNQVSNRKKIIGYASILGVIFLGIVYFVLTYLGVLASTSIPSSISASEILTKTFSLTVGSSATFALSMIILLACISTAIGILGVSANFIHQEFKWKSPYIAIGIIIISFFMALQGVDKIITLAAPFLEIIYTALILMLFVHLCKIKIPLVHKITVYTGIGINAIDILHRYFSPLHRLTSIFNFLPLYQEGLVWFIPSGLMMLFSFFFFKFKSRFNSKKISL